MNIVDAVEKRDLSTLKRVVEAGADVNTAHGEWTALMLAAANRDIETVLYLLSKGADPEVKFRGPAPHITALGWAAGYGYVDVTKILIDHGADVNAMDDDGTTLLMHIMVRKPTPEVVRLLLENGADPYVLAPNGVTAVDIAQYKGHQEICNVLRAYGRSRLRDPSPANNLIPPSLAAKIPAVSSLGRRLLKLLRPSPHVSMAQKDVAMHRIRQLQRDWCSCDVDPPKFFDHTAYRVFAVLDPESREQVVEVPVAVLHSHVFWQGPDIAAYQYSDGIRFVAIDYRFINLLSCFNTFVARQLIAEEDGDDSPRSFEENAKGALSQFGRLNGMMLPPIMPPPTDRRVFKISIAWKAIQKEFLVGHEYSHFFLQHLDGDRISPIELGNKPYTLPGGISLGFLTRHQDEELQADRHGARIAIDSLNRHNLEETDAAISIAGLELFFLQLEVMDLICDQLPPEIKARRAKYTHPHGSRRYRSFRSHFSQQVDGFGRDVLNRVQQFMARTAKAYFSGQYGTLGEICLKASDWGFLDGTSNPGV